MVEDPLSDMLAQLDACGSHFAGLRAGGDWALRFPPPEGVKFNAVLEGTCWLAVDGAGPPVRLEAGDCFLLGGGRAFTMASDPQREPSDALEVFRHARQGIAQCGAGDGMLMIGGRFAFREEARLLLDGLPPLAVVGGACAQAAVLRWSLRQLAEELAGTRPGAALMARQLGRMMLVQVLRLYLDTATEHPAGWLAALADRRLRAALAAIHAEPARRWTVGELAAVAGVSRSTFALHFRRKAGLAPLDYVLRWRIQLASRALRESEATVSSIAHSLGYDSDSAFSSAFRRVMACSPRAYRARRRAAVAAD